MWKVPSPTFRMLNAQLKSPILHGNWSRKHDVFNSADDWLHCHLWSWKRITLIEVNLFSFFLAKKNASEPVLDFAFQDRVHFRFFGCVKNAPRKKGLGTLKNNSYPFCNEVSTLTWAKNAKPRENAWKKRASPRKWKRQEWHMSSLKSQVSKLKVIMSKVSWRTARVYIPFSL